MKVEGNNLEGMGHRLSKKKNLSNLVNFILCVTKS
jgi:hypothetical protein